MFFRFHCLCVISMKGFFVSKSFLLGEWCSLRSFPRQRTDSSVHQRHVLTPNYFSVSFFKLLMHGCIPTKFISTIPAEWMHGAYIVNSQQYRTQTICTVKQNYHTLLFRARYTCLVKSSMHYEPLQTSANVLSGRLV